jgi:hypothetical protein
MHVFNAQCFCNLLFEIFVLTLDFVLMDKDLASFDHPIVNELLSAGAL